LKDHHLPVQKNGFFSFSKGDIFYVLGYYQTSYAVHSATASKESGFITVDKKTWGCVPTDCFELHDVQAFKFEVPALKPRHGRHVSEGHLTQRPVNITPYDPNAVTPRDGSDALGSPHLLLPQPPKSPVARRALQVPSVDANVVGALGKPRRVEKKNTEPEKYPGDEKSHVQRDDSPIEPTSEELDKKEKRRKFSMTRVPTKDDDMERLPVVTEVRNKDDGTKLLNGVKAWTPPLSVPEEFDELYEIYEALQIKYFDLDRSTWQATARMQKELMEAEAEKKRAVAERDHLVEYINNIGEVKDSQDQGLVEKLQRQLEQTDRLLTVQRDKARDMAKEISENNEKQNKLFADQERELMGLKESMRTELANKVDKKLYLDLKAKLEECKKNQKSLLKELEGLDEAHEEEISTLKERLDIEHSGRIQEFQMRERLQAELKKSEEGRKEDLRQSSENLKRLEEEWKTETLQLKDSRSSSHFYTKTIALT
jgi:hypothetical protein